VARLDAQCHLCRVGHRSALIATGALLELSALRCDAKCDKASLQLPPKERCSVWPKPKTYPVRHT
jgi:hypothetical protein